MAFEHILEYQLHDNTDGWTSSGGAVASTSLGIHGSNGKGFNWSSNQPGGYIETTFSCAAGTWVQVNAILGVTGSTSQSATYNFKMEVFDADGNLLANKTGSIDNKWYGNQGSNQTGGNFSQWFEFTSPEDNAGPFTYRITETGRNGVQGNHDFAVHSAWVYGYPLTPNYIVSGTSGDDIIDGQY
jgi:hypothetical protein